MSHVYVVSDTELGWDCVIGVHTEYVNALRKIFPVEDYGNLSEEELDKLYDKHDHCCVIHYKKLEA